MTLKPGTRIDSWTVIADLRDGARERRVHCRCACGRERLVYAPDLLRDRSRSCKPCSAERTRQTLAETLARKRAA